MQLPETKSITVGKGKLSKSFEKSSPSSSEMSGEYSISSKITTGSDNLVMVLETTRTKSMMVIFEEIEYSPDISEEDGYDFSNDLESFPFPTVMDFVSGNCISSS